MYEADDKMIFLIKDNYDLLQSLGSFGINLGFGDKTVREVCEDQNVDTYTFLAVVNFTINGYKEFDDAERISIPTLLKYLQASHQYYLEFELPFIRKELVEALDEKDNLARLILRLYDEYAHFVRNHMKYEEKLFSLMSISCFQERLTALMIFKHFQSITARPIRNCVS